MTNLPKKYRDDHGENGNVYYINCNSLLTFSVFSDIYKFIPKSHIYISNYLENSNIQAKLNSM